MISKETKSLMPWEQEYGYSQAVKVGTPSISGQVSHDDKGNLVGLADMEMQMRQSYSNIQQVHTMVLRCPTSSMKSFVTDMELSPQPSNADRKSLLAPQLWQVPSCKFSVLPLLST